MSTLEKKTKTEIMRLAKEIAINDPENDIIPDCFFTLTQKFFSYSNQEHVGAFNCMNRYVYDISKYYLTPFFLVRSAYSEEYNTKAVDEQYNKNRSSGKTKETMMRNILDNMLRNGLLDDNNDIDALIDIKTFNRERTSVFALGIKYRADKNDFVYVFYSPSEETYYYVDIRHFAFVSMAIYKHLEGYPFYFYDNKIYILNSNKEFSGYIFCI